MSTGENPLREHTFDGIQEFDNRLPRWWLWSFYLACIFAVLYWFFYHVTGVGMLPMQAFQREQDMEKMRQMQNKPMTDESLLEFASDPTQVAAGKVIFEGPGTCFACHLQSGGGQIGPNLTDSFWVHGSKPTQILETVTKGVPAKGMVPWGPILGPLRTQQVTAYVMSLKNTNVDLGKAPEGKEEK